MTDYPLEGFTAIGYARVSTDDKDQTTESQKREIKKWCEHQKVNLLEIYEEEKSAKDLDRPEFDRLIGRITRDRIALVVAWSESRISRDTNDMQQILGLFNKFNVKIRYVSSSSVHPEESGGELMNYINTWQAKEERAKLKINTKNGMTTAKRKGIHCGRPLALVFDHNFERDKARVRLGGANPTIIVTLESVFEFAKLGYSVSQTAGMIGVNRSTLERALDQEGHLGDFRNFACAKGDMCKRVETINTPSGKTKFLDGVQKGTLLNRDLTLLNTEGTENDPPVAKGSDGEGLS